MTFSAIHEFQILRVQFFFGLNHGRWSFKKNAKNVFFAVQIEKTEKKNLQKEWRKKLFYF